MRVVVDGSLFAPEPSKIFHRELLTLFVCGFDGRHSIEIEPEGTTAYLRWAGERDLQTREMCELAIEGGLKAARGESAPRFTIHVMATEKPAWRGSLNRILPPRAAVKLLERPLKILVENRISDGSFLKSIAIGDYQASVRRLIRENWIEFDSNGGITTNHRWIKSQIEDDPDLRTRLWVLFDSDALAPKKPHKNARDLARLCRRHKIQHHRLRRRSIENYLPVPALAQWSLQGDPKEQGRRKARISAFAQLNQEQRHHFNMKEGFEKDLKRDDRANAETLYEGVTPLIREALKHGIDPGIASLFRQDAVTIKEEWLLDDGQEDEIISMLTVLLSLV